MKQCPYCGKEYPDDVLVCVIDEYPLDGSEPEDPRTGDKPPAAGFGIRYLARFLDVVIGIFVSIAAASLTFFIVALLETAGMVAPGWEESVKHLRFLALVFSALGNACYHSLCEGIHGATLGKLWCGLRVMASDLQPPTFKGGVIRSFGYFFDGLLFGLVGYYSLSRSPMNQRYGDKWGKTVVVRMKYLPSEPKPSLGTFFLGFVPGIILWSLFVAAGLIWKIYT